MSFNTWLALFRGSAVRGDHEKKSTRSYLALGSPLGFFAAMTLAVRRHCRVCHFYYLVLVVLTLIWMDGPNHNAVW
jgi:hypothetical protein